MTWRRRNTKDEIILRDGYFPEREAIEKFAPKIPKQIARAPPEFSNWEELAAWTLNRRARQYALSHKWELGGEEAALEMPLETWILGLPKSDDAEFEDWFEGKSNESRYRIMIHRSPSNYLGNSVWIWGIVNTYAGNHMPIRFPKRGPAQQRALDERHRPFLDALINAYDQSPAIVEQVIKQSEHQYFYHLDPESTQTNCDIVK